jgi:Domain of unknown function (DUF4149)
VEGAFYSGGVSGFLRFVGIVNAAIWFGASIFFAGVVLPGVFSEDLHKLFGEETAYKYYAGGVAMALFRRFFVLQCVCGLVALVHLFAEKLYLGRAFPRLATAIAVGALVLSLIGGLGVQPRLRDFRQTMYSSTASAEQKAAAAHSFGLWHGASEAANLLMLAGLLVYLVRMARPEESSRYGTLFPTFRG